MSDSVKSTKTEEIVKSNWDSLPVTQFDDENTSKDVSQEEIKVEAESVERPVDLYKVFFFAFHLLECKRYFSKYRCTWLNDGS